MVMHAESCADCAQARARVDAMHGAFAAIRDLPDVELSWDQLQAQIGWVVSSEVRRRSSPASLLGGRLGGWHWAAAGATGAGSAGAGAFICGMMNCRLQLGQVTGRVAKLASWATEKRQWGQLTVGMCQSYQAGAELQRCLRPSAMIPERASRPPAQRHAERGPTHPPCDASSRTHTGGRSARRPG